MNRSCFLAVTFACAFACVAGCSREEPMGQVSGRVTFQGTPVPEGRITFHDADRGIFIAAPLEADGRYTVRMAQGLGLPTGAYRVTVEPPLPTVITGEAKNAPKREFPSIPPRYHSPATSPFRAEIQLGANDLPFEMIP